MHRATTKLRFGVISAVTLAMCLLSPAASYAGNGKRALSLLPADTALVITVNMSRMKKSALFGVVGKTLAINSEIARALALLKSGAGIDIPRDMKTAVLALAADFHKSEWVTLVLEGKVNAAKLASLATSYAKAVKRLVHAGTAYYRIDQVIEVVVLRGHLVLTNTGKAASLIDLARAPNTIAQRGKRLTGNKKMMALVKATDTRKDAWLVFDLPAKVRKNLSTSVPGADIVTAVTASLDTIKGMSARLRLSTTSAAHALTLATALGLGKTSLANHSKVGALGLSAAMRTLSVTRNGLNVDLAMRMSASELAKLERILQSI